MAFSTEILGRKNRGSEPASIFHKGLTDLQVLKADLSRLLGPRITQRLRQSSREEGATRH